MRIFISQKKNDIHRGHKARMNITCKGVYILMSPILKSMTVLQYGFSTMNKNVLLSLLLLKSCST